jgi:hypothetical protein
MAKNTQNTVKESGGFYNSGINHLPARYALLVAKILYFCNLFSCISLYR